MDKMLLLEPTLRQFLLIPVLILLSIDRVDAQGDPLLSETQFPCYNSDNYTSSSPFQKNLNVLLSTLVSNGSENGFFNTSIGAIPDIVYGLVQCKGDLSQDACRTCLNISTVEVIEICPNRKVAARRYDYCILRYSNVPFFSQVDYTVRSEYNTAQVSGADADRFNEQVKSLLTNVSEAAASRPNRFGYGYADYSPLEKVYGLVQCNEDLSPENCTSCVQNLISEITDCCDKRLGAKIFSATCYLRYELGEMPPPASPEEPGETDGSVNSTVPGSGNRRSSTNPVVIIVPTISSAVLLGICGYFISRRRMKNRRNSASETIYDPDDHISITAESLQFDLNTIRIATNNFSEENKLGEGGYGAVYKGELFNGREIAVKRLSVNSNQGLQEFKKEVTLLYKLQHRNLVRLLGFCFAGEEKLLIYEYIPNRSLDKYIFDSNKTSYLDWERRYKIIGGITRALLYLHEDSLLRIIHRDLKAGNVLLDDEMNAKVGDFGLARLFEADQTRDEASRVAGTLGYMPPEYLTDGLYSIKSDVFSFGVLLLEILSGRSVGKFEHSGPSWTLLRYAWQMWREDRPLDLIDPVLVDNFSVNEAMKCIHIALLCVQNNFETRPSMSSVALMLSSYSLPLESPSAPAFTEETIIVAPDPTESFLSDDYDLTLPR